MSSSQASEHKNRALAYLRSGHKDLALEEFKSALSLETAILGANHVVVAQTTLNVASILQAYGNYEDSLAMYHRSIQTLKESGGKSCLAELGSAYLNAGSCELSLGKYEDSLAANRMALQCKEMFFGENSIEVKFLCSFIETFHFYSFD